MHRFSRQHLSDDSLLDNFAANTGREEEVIADQIADIAEILYRRLHARLGFGSMRSYCVQVRHLSEDAAAKRIQVARKALHLPQIIEALADGRVHLTGMNLLAPFLDEENVDDLIAAATHKSKTEIELMLAERFPEPEAEEGIEDLPEGGSRHVRNRSGVRPLAPGRWLVQFTITGDEYERLQYALQLMSHRNPRGSLSKLNWRAMTLLIEELEKEKFAATDDPCPVRGPSVTRHVSSAVKREVWERDGGRCTFVSEAGRRCENRWMVEYDHVEPFARGGRATANNMRLLCREHNQYAAECSYGRDFMAEKRSGGSKVNGAAAVAHAPAHVSEVPVAHAPAHVSEVLGTHAPAHVRDIPDEHAPAHVAPGEPRGSRAASSD